MLFESAPCLTKVNLRHGFFLRHGGISSGPLSSLNCSQKVNDLVSNVHENRCRALSAIGCESTTLLVPNIVHGTNCVVVDWHTCPTEFANCDADAIITRDPRVSLGITYADCLPILVASTDGEVVGAIHAGWRGIKHGVIASTFLTIANHFKKNNLVAAIGPCISPPGFMVTDDVWQYFRANWPAFTENFEQYGRVNLAGIAAEQLKKFTIRPPEKIGGFTDLDKVKYFSHRRDQGETGRHLAVIAKYSSTQATMA